MLELTLKGDIGFTERIFITKIMVISVISDYPKYHGIIGILKSPFISVLQSITVSSHISGCRSLRLAKVSEYHQCYQIIGSFSLPNITAFISYHQVSHNCRLYRLNQLSWFFNYPNVPDYHIIVISAQWVERYLISLSITCWEVYQLVLSQMSVMEKCQFSQWRLYVGSAKAACISLR